MTNPPQEDLFERYESQYVRDLEGRLIRVEAATQADLHDLLSVTVDGQVVKDVPKAVPATDDQGNVLRDDQGRVVPRLSTVYDAASYRYGASNNPIPVLCHQNHLRPIGVCRVCSVATTRKGEAGGRLVPACQHPLVNGMEVHTVESNAQVQFPGAAGPQRAGDYVRTAVKVLLDLLAANHLHDDHQASNRRYQNELLVLKERFKGTAPSAPQMAPLKPRARALPRIDDSSPVIRLDHDNCILCDRCVRGCSEVKPFKIIGHTGFGNQARISFDLDQPMGESGCVSCGECAVSCPTGALTFKGTIYQDRDPWQEGQLRPATVPAEELEKMPLFAGVPYAFLKWNQGAVGRVTLTSGQELCTQGEYGSTAFIFEKGAVDVLVNGQRVATRTPDDVIVGELACLSHQPRSATLRAAAQGITVLVIKRNMLHMLRRNPGARNILGPIYRRRALDNYLQKGQLFAGLSPEQNKACSQFLANHKDVAFLQVDPGQAIFLQGSLAESFYIIYLGHVSVAETNAHGHSIVRDYLGPERHFGEIGLLSGISGRVAEQLPPEQRGRRTGACTALDHVELVAIHKPAFLALLNEVPDIRQRLEDAASAILEKNRQRRMAVGHLLDGFTRTGLYQGQNLLVLDLNRCTRCQECVKACAESHEGVTRLVLEGNRFAEYLVPSACRSCHDPACLVGCPVDAIHRKPAVPQRGGKTSLAIVIENHCIGCGLCAHNCPFGSIHMHDQPDGKRRANPAKRIATNCDLCESLDGVPRCVHRCPHDAAVRLTGPELARRVGLAPVGSARDK